MGKVPWKSFDEVPPQYIYNIDELATESTIHYQKIIGQFGSFRRAFQITPEGDSRMPFHTTIYLSFCATEIYSFPSGKVKGAPSRLITYNTLQQLDRKCRGKDNVHPEKNSFQNILPKLHVCHGHGRNKRREQGKLCK